MRGIDWKDDVVRRAFEKLALENLCLKDSDNLLVLSDFTKESFAEEIFNYAANFCRTATLLTYPPTGRHGLEPPESVWSAVFGSNALSQMKKRGLLDKVLKKNLSERDWQELKELLLKESLSVPTAVVAVSEHSLSHTAFRKILNEAFGSRFASMPLFDQEMVKGPMDADWQRVKELSEKIAHMLTRADYAFITCPLGSELKLSLKGRKGLADTGKLCQSGSFGNLPAGEAFIAPLEGQTEGRFVTNWAPNRKLSEPTVFYVKSGQVYKIEGDRRLSAWINGIFKQDPLASNIAELGVGTNEKAFRKDNILEAEKILGTVHVAVGDNSAFGGRVRANLHVDFIIENPTLSLLIDGKEVTLIKDGKLSVSV